MPTRPPSALRVALRPSLVGLHLFAVAAVVFCVFMGLWQLGVYDARQAGERADRQQVPTVPLDDALGPDEAFTSTANHRPVAVTGTFGRPDEQRWVGGKDRGGRDGYWLVAPVVTGDAGEAGRPAAVLVVRGWSAEATTPPPPPGGEVRLRGVLEPGEARTTAADPTAGPGADGVLDAVRIPLLANELPYDLYSGFLVGLAASPSDGLAAVPAPTPEGSWTTGLQNLAYALQWWVFGAFAIFMWWRITRDLVDREVAERRAEMLASVDGVTTDDEASAARPDASVR